MIRPHAAAPSRHPGIPFHPPREALLGLDRVAARRGHLLRPRLLGRHHGQRHQRSPAIVAWLVAGAIDFTLRFRFINLTGLRRGIDCVRGRYSAENDAGEVSHFQAFAAALSATLGLANIAGVAFTFGASMQRDA